MLSFFEFSTFSVLCCAVLRCFALAEFYFFRTGNLNRNPSYSLSSAGIATRRPRSRSKNHVEGVFASRFVLADRVYLASCFLVWRAHPRGFERFESSDFEPEFKFQNEIVVSRSILNLGASKVFETPSFFWKGKTPV